MGSALLGNIAIKPITNEADYEKGCIMIEQLMDLGEQSLPDAEAERMAYLDALTTLVVAYEEKNFAFHSTRLNLQQVLEQALDQFNLTRKDLARMLGSNRVSEIFSGKRELSMNQVRILHQQLRIPTDLLIMHSAAKIP